MTLGAQNLPPASFLFLTIQLLDISRFTTPFFVPKGILYFIEA